jgi:hypothetical protein
MFCLCSCHRLDSYPPVAPDHDIAESTGTLVSRIDDEIERSREHLRSLLCQRNKVVPVNRLPAELLCLIFSMVQERWSKPDPLRLAFTHVCKQWRFVALSCPALWNYVETESPSGCLLANETIQRAKGLPLLVNIETESNWAFKEALKMALRAHQLRVYVEDSDHVDAFNKALKLLRYTWTARSLLLEGENCDGAVNFPSNAKTPSLQVLHVHGMSIGWVPRDQGLSQLKILALRSAKQSCIAFWYMLCYANQVETLWVEDALPEDWSD